METNKQVKPMPARRFNANFATRAVLTLSAALLFGLGLRLGDVAVKSTAPKQTASAVQPQPEPTQPQAKAAASAKVVRPAAPQVTALPVEAAKAQVVAAAPVRVKTVYVQRQAQPAPTQPDRLIYASYRTNSESEHDGDDEEGDDGEHEYGNTRSRNTVSATPVRVVARNAAVTRATGQVQPRTVRPRVVQPAQNVQRVQPVQRAQTVQRAQPRFVARPPVQPKAVTRGS